MIIEEAINRLSTALSLLSNEKFDKELIRTLTNFIDQKHKDYIEQGLTTGDKTKIMHGIMGALSHYEAEKYRNQQAVNIA